MIKILLFSFSLFTVNQDSLSKINERAKLQHVFENFKQLLIDIREEKISPDSAQSHFQQILKELHEDYSSNLQGDSSQVSLVFPIRGKNWRTIGGKNGSGYRAKGFDLFDAKKKASHPAQDIFIWDRNQDCIEDRVGHYMDILSVSDGLVIATETNWQPGSDYRGGNYVWVYDFSRGGLWYYAHQRQVIVAPGQLLKAGDKIGEVGRSGYNAYQKRSETHLHLMYLSIDSTYLPHSVNTFSWLQNARTVN